MNLLWMFIGFILLVIGGEFIIRASVALSLKLNISKLVIGMTVVAFATSLPELIVSISAAINDSPSIAINNVIGSNIANIGLVLGLTCIIGNMYVEKSFYKIDWPVMFIFSIIIGFTVISLTFDTLKFPNLNWLFHSLLGLMVNSVMINPSKNSHEIPSW